MSQEPKYYTPSIEEFHVGFEYRHQIGKNHFIWSNWFPSLDYLQKLLDNKAITVKHLDKEDIESLGWEFKDTVKSPVSSKGTIFSKSIETGNVVFLTHFEAHKVLITICGAEFSLQDESLFYGTIKNKSELKKIMEMVGINL